MGSPSTGVQSIRDGFNWYLEINSAAGFSDLSLAIAMMNSPIPSAQLVTAQVSAQQMAHSILNIQPPRPIPGLNRADSAPSGAPIKSATVSFML